MFYKSSKSFMVVVVVYLQLQSLLRSRRPESEIEIELVRNWRHLELTWRWSGPEFDNSNFVLTILGVNSNFFSKLKACLKSAEN